MAPSPGGCLETSRQANRLKYKITWLPSLPATPAQHIVITRRPVSQAKCTHSLPLASHKYALYSHPPSTCDTVNSSLLYLSHTEQTTTFTYYAMSSHTDRQTDKQTDRHPNQASRPKHPPTSVRPSTQQPPRPANTTQTTRTLTLSPLELTESYYQTA